MENRQPGIPDRPADTADTASPRLQPIATRSAFRPGKIVAERYRIVRVIGHGGVGEVYEAEDLALAGRVALKTLRSERATQRSLERFKREVQVARQVTHPNVCRIYEFGQHEEGSQLYLFLTMELLGGRPLYERIHKEGPLSIDAAYPLACQMAAALSAAHRAGVVHRDFKSGNVLLVPGSDGERAVITDFGLARAAVKAEDGERHLTSEDAIVGTPAYIAPEQARGGAVTASSDIYAFGVVLFEMVTGRFPFPADSGIAALMQRLTEPPASPRTFQPDLPLRWERTILRCLEREPHRRFANADEIAAALAPDGAMPRPVYRPSRLAAAAALTLAVGAGAATVYFVAGSRSGDATAPSVPAASTSQDGAGREGAVRGGELVTTAAVSGTRRAIALLGFQNLNNEDDVAWLANALSETLAMEAAAGDHLRVVAAEQVTRGTVELGLQPNQPFSTETLSQLGEILGTDLVVLGSYLVADNINGSREIRLDVRVQAIATGEVVARISRRDTVSGVLDLVEDVGRELRRDVVGIGDLTAEAQRAVRAARPSNEAIRLYADGLAQLRLHNALDARKLLEEAAQLDPGHPLIHSALAAAWNTLGYRPKARAAAQRAFELADVLGERDRLWVEGFYYDTAGKRQEALDVYQRLHQRYPDDTEIVLRLANAQVRMRRAEDALATLAALRAKAPAESLRIDLESAQANRALSRYREQQELASQVADRAEALGARLLLARAREVEGGAWRDLGEPDQAMNAYETARKIYAETQHRGPASRNLIAMGKVLRHQGRFAEARELIDEALMTAREIGDQGSIQHALNTLAVMLRQQGKLNEALEMHLLELEANKKRGDERSVQVTTTSIGVALRQMGRLEDARQRFAEALAMAEASGNRRSMEINLNMLGDVLVCQGKLKEGRRNFELALEHNEATGSPRGRAYYLAALGEVDLIEGDLVQARQNFEEALRIRREIREQTNVAYSLINLAELEIAEGKPVEATARALDAAKELLRQDKNDAAAFAHTVVARASLAAGEIPKAQDAVVQAQALIQGSESLERSLQIELAVRAVAQAVGKPGQKPLLNDLRRRATEAGFFGLALEAELLAAPEGEERTRIADKARQHGFVLLAQSVNPNAPS